jgi:hypothetical protein
VVLILGGVTMAKPKRHMISFEVSKEEEALIEQRADQQGVGRSQYIREALIMEWFLSGDLEAYKYLGRRASVIIKEGLGEKFRELEKIAGQSA